MGQTSASSGHATAGGSGMVGTFGRAGVGATKLGTGTVGHRSVIPGTLGGCGGVGGVGTLGRAGVGTTTLGALTAGHPGHGGAGGVGGVGTFGAAGTGATSPGMGGSG